MKSLVFGVVSVLSLGLSAYGNLTGPPRPPVSELPDQSDALLSLSSDVSATFDQLIDHNNPSLGTFQQRYWYNTEFWKGPGSPIILFNPGEVAVVGSSGTYEFYLHNTTLVGKYAQAVSGATIVIEHRYWGESSPYTNLTSENLQYLTVDQAVEDMVHFATSVSLPFDTTAATNAPEAPWVLVGGSYSGALAAWTAITAPGAFWAYHASSAPVQAMENFWEYFQPIEQGMPQACKKDIIAVISHVDDILTTGADADKLALKTMFGLSTVIHDADFTRTLTYPLYQWQEGMSNFIEFCEAIEGVPAGQISPTSNGIGLDAALPNFASYMAKNYGCSAADCNDSYIANKTGYTNIQLNVYGGAGRQWEWMQCNEAFGWWQTGAPADTDSLVSRLVNADYYQSHCNYYFPGVEFGLTEDAHNAKYMGWNVENTTRLMFSNGEFDPWRSAGVSSEFRPGGPMNSTCDIPVFIVPGGIHTQDLYMGNMPPEIAALQVQEVAQMQKWIGEFYNRDDTPSSTVYATQTHTVISCHSSATDCPASSTDITTKTIDVTTTACPVTISSYPITISTHVGPVYSSESSQPVGTGTISSSPATISTHAGSIDSPQSLGTGAISFSYGGKNSTYSFPTASAPRPNGTGSSPSLATGSSYIGLEGVIPRGEKASHTPIPFPAASSLSARAQHTGSARRLDLASVELISLVVLIGLVL